MSQSDKIRIKILNYSLTLEKLASYIVGFAFDIKDINESKSLGNTSSSLSFNQKLNLLLDYKAIDKKDKTILDSAMSIRNQFMHNYDVNNYQEVFACLDGEEKKLRKIYIDLFKDVDNELNLEECVEMVFNDSFKILRSLKGGIENKIIKITESEVNKQAIASFLNVGRQKFEELSMEIFDDKIDFQNKQILLDRLIRLNREILDESMKGITLDLQKLKE